MKKFFKKLSFGLALAMAVSTLAPAAGAFAAAAPKLNATKKYLHLDKAGANEYDFNIKNKQKGWSYDWYAQKDSVVSVNAKNGVVTAEGVGTSKVYCEITDKDGEVVKTLTATVVVRDNIETVKISNAPEGDTLAVGEEFDFNRSFVTVSGSTKKTSAITRWSVKEEGAKINDKGVFSAEKAGTYTVVAQSFQSTAKYDAWKTDSAKYASYVLATDEYTVTVGANIVETKQVDSTTFKVVFDTDMSKEIKLADISLSRVVGTTAVATQVKEISFSADGKTMTVVSYVTFVEDSTYKVAVKDMNDSFVAAKAAVENVASIEFKKNTVTTQKEANLGSKDYIALKNADGVDIATDSLLARVTFAVEGTANGYLNTATKGLTLYKNGDAVTIKATYHTYKYVGAKETVFETTSVLTATDTDTSVKQESLTYAFDADFTTDTKIAVGEGSKTINFKYQKNDDKTDWYTGTADGVNFKFEGSNDKIAVVYANGTVIPVSEGVVTAVLYNKVNENWIAIGTVNITVLGERKVATLKADWGSSATVANSGSTDTSSYKQYTAKDQFGDPVSIATLNKLLADGKVSLTRIDTTKTTKEPVISSVAFGGDYKKAGIITFNFNLSGCAEGDYAFKLTVGDISDVLTIKVVDTSKNTTVTSYAASYSYGNNTLDFNNLWETKVNVPFSVKSVNSQGFGIADVTSTVNIEVTAPDNKTYTKTNIPTKYDIFNPVTAATATSSSAFTGNAQKLSFIEKGQYVITVKNAEGKSICNPVYVVIKDTADVKATTVATSVNLSNLDATPSLKEAVAKTLNITVNGTQIAADKVADKIVSITYRKGGEPITTTSDISIAADDKIVVEKITFVTDGYKTTEKKESEHFYREFELNVAHVINVAK